MTITIAGIRRAVADRILVLGGDWWQAPVPFDLFGISQVPNAIPAQRAHQAFAVGVPTTGTFMGRQRPEVELFAQTAIRVRFLATHHQGGGSLTSQDAALDLEQTLIQHLMARSDTWPGSFTLQIDGLDRAVPAPGNWVQIDLRFTALHPFALQ